MLVSRIFCIVGKSASGKDTFYKKILSLNCPHLVPVCCYTTRPKRAGETEGIDYHFVNIYNMNEFENQNKLLEKRAYHTTKGTWYYFTLFFETDNKFDYVLVTTLEGASAIAERYGMQNVHIVYLLTDERIRLLRCIDRESRQPVPDYSEVCRRFLADEADFSNEAIHRFTNVHIVDTGTDVENRIEDWRKIYGS